MIVQEIPAPIVSGGLPGEPERPEGLHLSTIIKDMMVTLKPASYGKPFAVSKVLMGNAFERVLEQGFLSVQPDSFRPPPIQKDGIWMSPDHVGQEPWRVKEFKCTWYSMNKSCPWDKVFWPWLVQIKGYCLGLETLLAELWVFFVNGDYKPPSPVEVPRVYQLTFTELELFENWSMIVNYAKYRGWL